MTTSNSGTSEREGDEEELEQMQQEHETELLHGSAPCTSFRTLLHTSEKTTKEQIEKAQDEERQYTSVHQNIQETVDHG